MYLATLQPILQGATGGRALTGGGGRRRAPWPPHRTAIGQPYLFVIAYLSAAQSISGVRRILRRHHSLQQQRTN